MKIERVICAPLNYSHNQDGQIGAFQEIFGADNVVTFDYMRMRKQKITSDDINADLVKLAADFKPDWIWMQLQGTNVIRPDALAIIKQIAPKCLVTHWMGDVRTRIPDELVEICRATDATLISNVGQIPLYESLGAKRVEYVQIGLDPSDTGDPSTIYESPWDPPFRVPDVVFIGNFYGDTFADGTNERVDAIRALVEAGIDIGVVGGGAWPSDIPVVGKCHVKQQYPVYKRAKVALSISHFNTIERYYSDRQLISMASGTPVVCRYVPGLEHEFVDGEECAFWDPLRVRLVDCVRMLLDDPERAAQIGRQGRATVLGHHTWTRRIRDLRPRAESWRDAL